MRSEGRDRVIHHRVQEAARVVLEGEALEAPAEMTAATAGSVVAK